MLLFYLPLCGRAGGALGRQPTGTQRTRGAENGYGRAVSSRGQMKMDTDEDFLLESCGVKCRAPHQIKRREAQFVGGILQGLGVDYRAILCAEDGVHNHRLIEVGRRRV